MALPVLKLKDLTGSPGLPATVVLHQVLQQGGEGRRRLGRVPMERNAELERNLFVFDELDDRASVLFENPLQFRIVVTDDDGHDLAETVIESSDANKPNDELFIDLFANGVIGGPFYQLGYRVQPG